MPGIALRRRRWSPGPGADINPSHPLLNGLLGLGVAGRLVYPRQEWLPSATTVYPTGFGPGAYSSGSNGVAIGTLPAQTDASSFTFFAVALSVSTSAGGPIIGYRNGGGPGLAFCKLSLGDGGSTYAFGYYANGNSRYITGTGMETGRAYALCAIKKGLDLQLWVDGRRRGTITGYTTGQLDQNAATIYYGGDENRDGAIAMGGAVARAWSEPEVAQFTADPFCMLRGG